MRRSLIVLAIAGMLVGALAAPAMARGKGNPNPATTVYVTGQGLTYDSIVPITPDKGLPFNGKDNWQLLEMGDTVSRPNSVLEIRATSGDGGSWTWMATDNPPKATSSSYVPSLGRGPCQVTDRSESMDEGRLRAALIAVG